MSHKNLGTVYNVDATSALRWGSKVVMARNSNMMNPIPVTSNTSNKMNPKLGLISICNNDNDDDDDDDIYIYILYNNNITTTNNNIGTVKQWDLTSPSVPFMGGINLNHQLYGWFIVALLTLITPKSSKSLGHFIVVPF